MVNTDRAVRELLDFFKEHEDDVRLSRFKATLDAAVLTGVNSRINKALGEYVDAVADAFVNRSLVVINASDFMELPHKVKADIVREVLSLSVSEGFNISSRITGSTYTEEIKAAGVALVAIPAIINAERLRSAVGGTINHAISGDVAAMNSTMEGSFKNIIKSGERETIKQAGERVEVLTGKRTYARRVIDGPNPCKYCLDQANIWWRSGEAQEEKAYAFHDYCACIIEFKIE